MVPLRTFSGGVRRGARVLLGAVVWGFAMLALGACTSTISGTPTFAGPTDTTETSTEETTEETEETTEETSTEPEETAGGDEFVACFTVEFSYIEANANFVELANATNSGTPTTLTPESVAADFDAAIAAVQPVLDPLPPGPIRDAVQAAQVAAAGLRDGLRAGTAVDNTALIQAVDALALACEF